MLARTLTRTQNWTAKCATLLRRRSTLPIWVYYLSMATYLRRIVAVLCVDHVLTSLVLSHSQLFSQTPPPLPSPLTPPPPLLFFPEAQIDCWLLSLLHSWWFLLYWPSSPENRQIKTISSVFWSDRKYSHTFEKTC